MSTDRDAALVRLYLDAYLCGHGSGKVGSAEDERQLYATALGFRHADERRAPLARSELLAEVARLCSEQPVRHGASYGYARCEDDAEPCERCREVARQHDATEAVIAAKGEGYREGAADVIAKVEAWWDDGEDRREADQLVADLRREFGDAARKDGGS